MKSLLEYFSTKYNYPDKVLELFYKDYYKQLLYYAGYYEKKESGKIAFKQISEKNSKDYIHYFASQSRFFRNSALWLKQKILK